MPLGRKAIGTVAYLGGLPAVLEEFAWSWSQMIQHNQEIMCEGTQYVHYDRATYSDHAPARNSLARQFLGDWLIQFDTDHAFEADIVSRLVRFANEHEVDVLSGVYQLKNPPHVPVLYQWVKVNPDSDELGLQPLARWPKEAKILQIGSAGGGCLFVRRSVFDRIASEYSVGPFDKIHPFSEDHSFFLRCRELGIKCYAAMNVMCHHLRVAPVTFSDICDDEIEVSEQFPVGGFV